MTFNSSDNLPFLDESEGRVRRIKASTLSNSYINDNSGTLFVGEVRPTVLPFDEYEVRRITAVQGQTITHTGGRKVHMIITATGITGDINISLPDSSSPQTGDELLITVFRGNDNNNDLPDMTFAGGDIVTLSYGLTNSPTRVYSVGIETTEENDLAPPQTSHYITTAKLHYAGYVDDRDMHMWINVLDIDHATTSITNNFGA